MRKPGKARSDISEAMETSKAAPRVEVDWKVGMMTFGSRNEFQVNAKNVSSSGLLLAVDDPKLMAPFQQKTLLELIVYPDGKILKEIVKATAVVVRSVHNEAGDRRELFGVRIVEAPQVYEMAVEKMLAAA